MNLGLWDKAILLVDWGCVDYVIRWGKSSRKKRMGRPHPTTKWINLQRKEACKYKQMVVWRSFYRRGLLRTRKRVLMFDCMPVGKGCNHGATRTWINLKRFVVHLDQVGCSLSHRVDILWLANHQKWWPWSFHAPVLGHGLSSCRETGAYKSTFLITVIFPIEINHSRKPAPSPGSTPSSIAHQPCYRVQNKWCSNVEYNISPVSAPTASGSEVVLVDVIDYTVVVTSDAKIARKLCLSTCFVFISYQMQNTSWTILGGPKSCPIHRVSVGIFCCRSKRSGGDAWWSCSPRY